MKGWTKEWPEGWMEGWIEGWMEGWMMKGWTYKGNRSWPSDTYPKLS
jgi:hypothetical protein